jgi:hypothetical protein
MGTLRGFPNPPAHWLRRAKLGFANAVDGNAERVRVALGTACSPCHPLAALGLANLPAHWLRRAKLGFANAVDGNAERVRVALGTACPSCHPLAALGLGTACPSCHPLAALGLANPPAHWRPRSRDFQNSAALAA